MLRGSWSLPSASFLAAILLFESFARPADAFLAPDGRPSRTVFRTEALSATETQFPNLRPALTSVVWEDLGSGQRPAPAETVQASGVVESRVAVVKVKRKPKKEKIQAAPRPQVPKIHPTREIRDFLNRHDIAGAAAKALATTEFGPRHYFGLRRVAVDLALAGERAAARHLWTRLLQANSGLVEDLVSDVEYSEDPWLAAWTSEVKGDLRGDVSPRWYALLAPLYRRAGDLEGLLRVKEKAIRAGASDALRIQIEDERTLALQVLKRRREALEVAMAARREFPHSPQTALMVARSAALLLQTNTVIHYALIAEEDPTIRVPARRLLARAYARRGDLQKAMEHLELIHSENPARRALDLAEIFFEGGDWDLAIEQAKVVEDDYPRYLLAAYRIHAKALFEMGSREEAFRIAEEARRAFDQNSHASASIASWFSSIAKTAPLGLIAAVFVWTPGAATSTTTLGAALMMATLGWSLIAPARRWIEHRALRVSA